MNHIPAPPAGRLPVRTKQLLVVVSAILLYGIFAGIRVNTSLLSTQLSLGTGIPYGEVSYAFSVLNIVLACSIPVLAVLTLKVRHFYLFLVGSVLCAVGFFGASLSKSAVDLIVFLGIIFGIGASVLSFTMVYSAAKPFFGVKGSTILSGVLIASQGGLGIVLSLFIGHATESFGLQACLLLISVAAVCLIPFAFVFSKRKAGMVPSSEEKNAVPVKIRQVLKRMLTSPFFYLLFFAVFAFGMGDGFLLSHLSQSLYEFFNVDQDDLSVITALYALSAMSGSLLGGFLAARVKNKGRILAVVFLSWVAVNIALRLLLDSSQVGGTDLAVLLAAFFFLCGFLLNNTFVLVVALVADHVSTALCAVVIGILECIEFLSYSFCLFLGGLLHDLFGGFGTIYTIVFIICGIAGLLFLVYSIRQKNTASKIYF